MHPQFKPANYNNLVLAHRDAPKALQKKVNHYIATVISHFGFAFPVTREETLQHMFTASKKGNWNLFLALYKLTQIPLTVVDSKGITFLHYAAANNRIQFVQNLVDMRLETGVNVNALDNYQHTPLYYAVKANNTTMARLLLNNGAKTDKKIMRLPHWKTMSRLLANRKTNKKNHSSHLLQRTTSYLSLDVYIKNEFGL